MRGAIVIVALALVVAGCGGAAANEPVPVYSPPAPAVVETAAAVPSYLPSPQVVAEQEHERLMAEQRKMNAASTPEAIAAAIETRKAQLAEEKARDTIAKCAPTQAVRVAAEKEWAIYDAGRNEASAWSEAHCRVRDTRRLVVTTTRTGAATTEQSIRNAGAVDYVCTAVMPKKLQAKQDAPAPTAVRGQPFGCEDYDAAHPAP